SSYLKHPCVTTLIWSMVAINDQYNLYSKVMVINNANSSPKDGRPLTLHISQDRLQIPLLARRLRRIPSLCVPLETEIQQLRTERSLVVRSSRRRLQVLYEHLPAGHVVRRNQTCP